MSSDSFTRESNIAGNIGTAPVSLPREAILDTVPRSSLAASKRIVNLVPITSNVIGPSQTLQFLLPPRNLAKANSVYLKFRFSATGGSASQLAWGFSGGMQSAAALINNISIQAGGVILESLQNYHAWHNNVLEWMNDSQNMLATEALCSGSQLPGGNAGVGAVSYFLATADTANTTLTVSGTNIHNIAPGQLVYTAAGVYLGRIAAYGTGIGGVGTYTLEANSASTVSPAAACIAIAPSRHAQQLAGYDNDVNLVNNTTTTGWVSDDANNCSVGAFGSSEQYRQFASSAAANQTINIVFTIPLFCGFFNPKESQLIPLEFINGGVLLTLQTNPVTKAFWTNAIPTAANCFTTYSMSDFELCYTEIQPAPEYLMQVRQDLQAGRTIKIETQSYQNFLLSAGSGNTRQMFNANLSSLSCILFGRMVGADNWNTSKMFQWVGNDGNNTTRYEIYFDNQLMYQSPRQLNDISVVVRQLQEAIQSSCTDYGISPNCTGRGIPAAWSGSPVTSNASINYATYCGGHALMGLSTRVFSSNSTSMDGTPVGTVTINFYNDDGEANTNLWYFYLVYDYIYLVDGSGSVSKVQ